MTAAIVIYPRGKRAPDFRDLIQVPLHYALPRQLPSRLISTVRASGDSINKDKDVSPRYR